MPTDNGKYEYTFEIKDCKLFKDEDKTKAMLIEDDYSYKFNDSVLELREHIEMLQCRITELKTDLAYLEGKNQAYREFWRTWCERE